MRLTLLIEIIFFSICICISVIFLINVLRKDEKIDIDKWIEIYKEQKKRRLIH